MLADVDMAGLAETARLIPEGRVLTQITDVSDASAVRHLADRTYGELGAVHLLCNNAGVFQGGHLWTRTPEDFEWVLGVNLWGVLNGIHAFVPRMIEQDTEGHVVNTVSVSGLFAAPYAGAYALSKYAAFAASQSLAHDLAAAGAKLRVTALCPGPVRTALHRSERVRPADLAMARSRDDRWCQDGVDQVVANGMDPAEVAAQVVEAVREERFLVLTHEGYDRELREQTEALLAGRVPPVPRYE
jgi:NAD(P)-dependent dehydrogenase (short-subunit alcohol dehydrogenase family)